MSSSEEDDKSSKEMQIADQVMEMQKRLNHDNKDIINMKTLHNIEEEKERDRIRGGDSADVSEPEMMKKSMRRDMSDFDQLLDLIDSAPGIRRPIG